VTVAVVHAAALEFWGRLGTAHTAVFPFDALEQDNEFLLQKKKIKKIRPDKDDRYGTVISSGVADSGGLVTTAEAADGAVSAAGGSIERYCRTLSPKKT